MSEHMQNYYGSLCTEMYEIREIRPEEYPLLDDFLYEAIYIPENVEAPHTKNRLTAGTLLV